MPRTQEQWIAEYRAKNALWVHDKNLKRPHALLTSGKHSSGFFNSRLVIPDEVLLRDAASDLLVLLSNQGGDFSQIDGVVGPQTGATLLASYMSEQIMAYTRNDCFYASPAKQEKSGSKSMVFTEHEVELLRGKKILLCEDVLTTGLSMGLTAQAVTDAGGTVLPFVLVLVNRTGFTRLGMHQCRTGLVELGAKPIVALINVPMPIWEPEQCPLCKGGSEAVHPKENWERLNKD